MSFACVLNHFSHVQLFVTLWTVGCQAPLSMGFSGKNASLGFSFLLQCIFLTQGLKLHLVHFIGQMVNTEIRLIIFSSAKDGEALYGQQKQDQELTVAQIMNSLLPNSDLN